MIVNYDRAWVDPDSSWCVKANRANEHIASLRSEVGEFRALAPYSLDPEPTEDPNRLAYRLNFRHPFPARIGAIVGDILSNLRSALEALAFELAVRSNGGTIPAGRERHPTFPICRTPDEFDTFMRSWRIAGLFNQQALLAFRSVQPFWFLEEAARHEVTVHRDYDDYYRWSELARLDALWNVDKHRRLALLAWWPDLIYWGSNGPSNRRMLRGDGTVGDGSILFYIEGSDEGQGNRLSHEFNIVLTDDPAFDRSVDGTQDDLVGLLDSWFNHIVGLVVFPRIFTIMSQDGAQVP